VTATVIRLADLRDARNGTVDTRTETQRLVDQARAEGFRAAAVEYYAKGMRDAMESMYVEAPTMLPVRSLSLVEMGGWAS
jgi:hypothetical protein